MSISNLSASPDLKFWKSSVWVGVHPLASMGVGPRKLMWGFSAMGEANCLESLVRESFEDHKGAAPQKNVTQSCGDCCREA